MSKLKDLHPQKDLFVVDLADVAPRDDMASMEHPLFSLATKPDQRHLTYETETTALKIVPSGEGLPTIFDKDILIYCISKLIDAQNRGEEVSNTVRFTAHDMLKATNRRTDGDSYQRLEKAFTRLGGTLYKTNIMAGDHVEKRQFSLIGDGSGFVFKDNKAMRLDYCEIVLSEWVMSSIRGGDVLAISPEYFKLRRPLERRLYEIARKHCGNQKSFEIGMAKLQAKTGSNAPLNKFRMNMREIIKADNTPFYRFEIGERDKMIIRPRSVISELTADIRLPEWAEEKARQVAIEKGRDYHAMRSEWLAFTKQRAAQGVVVDNAGAAFVGFAKSLKKLR